jgi:hypothetical protein
MYVGFHAKYRYSCQILMKHEFARQSLEKYPNIKFNENLPSASRIVPCGRAIVVGFYTFAKVPERRVQCNLSWITMRRRTVIISSNVHEQLQNTAVLFSCHHVCC